MAISIDINGIPIVNVNARYTTRNGNPYCARRGGNAIRLAMPTALPSEARIKTSVLWNDPLCWGAEFI